MTTDLPNASQNGQAHLAYFDGRTQASFVWDGASDVIEVSLGGYGEPVHHRISSLVVVTNGRIEEDDSVRHQGLVNINWFRAVCERHARVLPTFPEKPRFGKTGGWTTIAGDGDLTRHLAYNVEVA